MKERATFLEDIWNSSQFFFERPIQYDEKTRRKKWKENTPDVLDELISLFESLEDFSASNIEVNFKNLIEEKEWGLGMVLPPFRLAVTGVGMGPSMFEVCALLGKREVIDRIQKAIQTLS